MRDVDVKRVIFAIRRDVAFLKSQGLMDYSLLIVIEKCNEKQNEKNIAGSTHERTTAPSTLSSFEHHVTVELRAK